MVQQYNQVLVVAACNNCEHLSRLNQLNLIPEFSWWNMSEKHVVLWCYDRKLTNTSTILKAYHCNKLVGLSSGMSIHFPCAQIHISCANHHSKITSSVHWAIQLPGLAETPILSSVKQVFSGSFININSVGYSRVFFYLLCTVHAPPPRI